jgi:hypothetical protein
MPMSLTVTVLHPKTQPEHLGLIPEFMNEGDPRPAREQIHDNYRHGGGWHGMPGFKLTWKNELPILQYPGDPPLIPLAVMRLRQERIFVYLHGITAIVQPDGTFEASRLD